MVRIGNFLFHYRNILFPCFYALLFIPSPKLFENYTFAVIAGLAISLSGQVIRVLTIGLVYIIRGGSKRRIYAKDLVTTGMFSHCRNPLYIGNILILVGLGFIANSLWFALFVVPVFLFAYQAIVLSEEAFLRGKFGQDFNDYTNDVNRWLPRFSGISETLKSMKFNWKRVVLKEYTATYIWTAGALILGMRAVYGQCVADGCSIKWLFIAGLSVLTALYFGVMFVKKKKLLRAD